MGLCQEPAFSQHPHPHELGVTIPFLLMVGLSEAERG